MYKYSRYIYICKNGVWICFDLSELLTSDQKNPTMLMVRIQIPWSYTSKLECAWGCLSQWTSWVQQCKYIYIYKLTKNTHIYMYIYIYVRTALKFNIAPENDGWKTIFLLGKWLLRGYVKLQGGYIIKCTYKHKQSNVYIYIDIRISIVYIYIFI